MLAKARGQEQAEKLLMASSDWTDGITTRIWENLRDVELRHAARQLLPGDSA